MEPFEDALREQKDAAARRVAERMVERQGRKAALETGGLAAADDPERVAKRLDRLSRYYGTGILPSSLSAVATAEPEAIREAGAVLEKIILTEDFVDVRYLEGGVAAARAVGRVNVRNEAGRIAGYGSGSLVSPRLFLTNHHVLPSADVARVSGIEFNYQDGLDGQPLPPKLLPIDPGSFFLADEELDFALVAVGASEQELAEFGFNPLIEAEGKAIVGECVTIVQHPRGEKKQVALRENRIVDLLELFMHYEADTEPGSSGSPVFNDQWEVVALHHASVPAPEHTELGGYVNEGIRVSRLIRFIRAQNLPPGPKALSDQLWAERIVLSHAPAPMAPPQSGSEPPWQSTTVAPEGGAMRVTIPLEISVRVGNAPAGLAAPRAQEAIRIDPDYASRTGYDPAFLGNGPHSVPLPTVAEDLLPQASSVLPYHHFSVVMNKERRLAFFTASNIDGELCLRLKRERDRWFFDPRVPEDEQTGEEVYEDNDLDRGHLVRRLDPAWGESRDVAKLANDDTFHFTNCTPQHKDFNQRQTSWAGLEDYILENADNRDFRISVFTGPVFAPDDDEYRGVRLPRQFWKVVAMVKESGALSATAYLLSQKELIEGLERAEEFSYGEYRTFQLPVRRVEDLTRLSFGALADADPLGQLEAIVEPKEIRSPDDLVL